ncbi:MAG: hypothetical protein AB7F64_07035 [Gammaproteobacteria bacterium]
MNTVFRSPRSYSTFSGLIETASDKQNIESLLDPKEGLPRILSEIQQAYQNENFTFSQADEVEISRGKTYAFTPALSEVSHESLNLKLVRDGLSKIGVKSPERLISLFLQTQESRLHFRIGSSIGGYLLNLLPSSWGILSCDIKNAKVQIAVNDKKEEKIIYETDIVYSDNYLNNTLVGKVSMVVRILPDRKIVFDQFYLEIDDEKLKKSISSKQDPAKLNSQSTFVPFDEYTLLKTLTEQENILNTLSYAVLIQACKDITAIIGQPTNQQIADFDEILKGYDLKKAPAWVAKYVQEVSDYIHGRLFKMDFEAIEDAKVQLQAVIGNKSEPYDDVTAWVGSASEVGYRIRDAAARLEGIVKPDPKQCAMDAERFSIELIPPNLSSSTKDYTAKVDAMGFNPLIADLLKNRYHQGSLMGWPEIYLERVFDEYDMYRWKAEGFSFTGLYDTSSRITNISIARNDDGTATVSAKTIYPRKDKKSNLPTPVLEAKFHIIETNQKIEVIVENFDFNILDVDFRAQYLDTMFSIFLKKIQKKEQLLTTEQQAHNLMVAPYIEPSVNGLMVRTDTASTANAKTLLLVACDNVDFAKQILSNKALAERLSTDELTILFEIYNRADVWEDYQGPCVLLVQTYLRRLKLTESTDLANDLSNSGELFKQLKAVTIEYLESGLLSVQVTILPIIQQWWGLILDFKKQNTFKTNRLLSSTVNDFSSILLKSIEYGFVSPFDALNLNDLDVKTAAIFVADVIKKDNATEVDSLFRGASLVNAAIGENLRKVFEAHPSYIHSLLNSRAAISQLSMLRQVDESAVYLPKFLPMNPELLKQTWAETCKEFEKFVHEGKNGSENVQLVLAITRAFPEKENPDFYRRFMANARDCIGHNNTCQMHQPRAIVSFLKQYPDLIPSYLSPTYYESVTTSYRFKNSRIWLDSEEIVELLLATPPARWPQAILVKPTYLMSVTGQPNYRELFLKKPESLVTLFMKLEPQVFQEKILVDQVLTQAFVEALIKKFAKHSILYNQRKNRLRDNSVLLSRVDLTQSAGSESFDDVMINKLSQLMQIMKSYVSLELVDLLLGNIRDTKLVGSQPFCGRYTPIAFLLSSKFKVDAFDEQLNNSNRTRKENDELAYLMLEMITHHQFDSVLADPVYQQKFIKLIDFMKIYLNQDLQDNLSTYLNEYNRTGFNGQNKYLLTLMREFGIEPPPSPSLSQRGLFDLRITSFAQSDGATDTKAVKEQDSPNKYQTLQKSGK